MADAAQFDKRMAAAGGQGEHCIWHAVPCEEIDVRGLGFFASEHEWNRLPGALMPEVRVQRPALVELAQHMAGASLHFCTDSPEVWVRAEVNAPPYMSHMTPAAQCGFDCYVRFSGGAWLFAGVTKFPLGTAEICARVAEQLPAGTEVCVNLPLYTGVKRVEIGLCEGAALHKAPSSAHSEAIAFYGTSITQGGCASRPGMAYPAILERMLDRPTYNLGFSGNGVGMPLLAGAICALPQLGALVVDIEPNAGPEGLLRQNLPRFLDAVRAYAPALPVLVLSGAYRPACAWDTALAAQCDDFAAFERNEVARRQSAGDTAIQFADARALTSEVDAEATVDGVHLTDLGFYALAQGLVPILQALLKD